VSATPEEVESRVAASPRSRYPVIDGDLDRVVGVVHIKEVIRARELGSSLGLDQLAQPLHSVPATATAEQLLERFKRDRMHASLVVDEFGGTLGLVTLDDVIAEVMDEGATDGSPAVRHPDGSVSLDGEVTLAELRDDHGLSLAHAEVTTVAGLVLASLGRIPEVGATVALQGHEVTVEEMQGRKITRVRVRPAT
jgi:CBS domain containing-hemolysin-like protein